MRNILLIVGVLVTSFLFAGLAYGQADVIGIFTDQTGTDPYVYDRSPGEINLYVVHLNSPGTAAVQFSAPKPDCFNATYLGDTNMFPVTIGNSQEFVAVGYGACLASPIHVLTMRFFGNGDTGNCCNYDIGPYEAMINLEWVVIEPILIVNCDEEVFEAVGGTAIINPEGCGCAQPTLTLDGYETVSWEAPYWAVQVQMRNTGRAAALNVSATMHEDIPWLITPDANCFYGDIPVGVSSWGGTDTYVFDLTDHPGGPFNAWFDVSYVDTCGYEHTVRLDPEFSVEEVTASAPDAAPAPSSCLGANYPNPFNPTTTIPLNITEAGNVHLSIFDSQGKLVRVLVDEHVPVGSRQVIWNGRDSNGSAVSSGVYFARLTTGAAMETRKLVLLK